MHGSKKILDAIEYARGPIISWCEFDGEIIHGDDKFVAQSRTVLWWVDGTKLLRNFACDEALRVLPKDAPDIVSQYLTTQDESIRAAAWAATRAAAWESARAAAWAAARAAAWESAWGAAWDEYQLKQEKRLLKMIKQAGWKA
jgi:hypothetical protein